MRFKEKEAKLPVKKCNTFNYQQEIKKEKVWRVREEHHHSILNKFNTQEIVLPEQGSFNPGILKYNDKYIFVYRSDETSFVGCLLDSNFTIIPNTFHYFNLINCADPRLIFHGDRVLMSFSYVDKEVRTEHIRAYYIWEDDKFIDGNVFRISKPSKAREKNWAPFLYKDEVFLIGNYHPLKIYDIHGNLRFEHQWSLPENIKGDLRGNTPLIKLNDGTMLGTFHTVELAGRMHLYDNYIILLKDKPPFRVMKCSNKTYICAEDSIYPHFRKKNQIMLHFPCGMILENNNIIISTGENDSVCKIIKTNINELLKTTEGIH